MKKLNQAYKMFAVLGVFVLLASMIPSFVSAAARSPRDPDGRGVVNLEYVGGKACRADNTTTSKSCATSSGLLYALCAYGTGAVAGKGSQAFDTATAADITGFASLLAISPIVYGTAATATTGNEAAMPKCWIPPVPVRFEGGLAIKQDDAGHDSIAIYRLDSGVNP